MMSNAQRRRVEHSGSSLYRVASNLLSKQAAPAILLAIFLMLLLAIIPGT